MKASMRGVIFEHVDHVIKRDKGVIDGNDLGTFFNRGSQDQTTNAPEAIDANFSRT